MLPGRSKRIGLCNETIGDLVQSVMNARKEISLEDMEKRYLKEYPADTVRVAADKYGLDIGKDPAFIAWPVFLGTGFDEINICAVNFGAQTLFNRHRDGRFLHDGKHIYINAALNTLVVTSLSREKNGARVRYWPTHIDFTNKVESGTVIQATLALSSLFKFGFLRREPLINTLTPTLLQLINRFRFVIEALRWILDLERVYGDYGVAWSYAEDCKEAQNDKRIISAILPSQFCYETLMRYYLFFTENEDNETIVKTLDPTLLSHMRQSLEAFEEWVKLEQRADGGYRRNSNQTESSFAFSLCAMPAYAYDKEKDLSRLDRLIRYLCEHHQKFSQPLSEVVDAYQYKYEASEYSGYVNDAYEVFPESFFILNSCKNFDNGTTDLLSPYRRRRLRVVNYIAYEKLLKRLTAVEVENTGKNTVITGRQEMAAYRYPIYALYYSKKSLEKLRDNDRLPKKERKKYIAMPLNLSPKVMGLSVILLLLVALSYMISATDTITSIVLGLAAFIMPMIGNMLLGDRHGK
ncbi:MAG: hypothetical protein IKC63_01360 [Clostridia bacterium]|nr:hypothetical protein [Clostridia bacterium]